MASYDDSAELPQNVYPVNAVDGTAWSRCEPLLTPRLLVQRFLFGVPLVSQNKNPITKEPDVKTPEILEDHIYRAVSTLEAESGLCIFPVQFEDELPFDRVFLEQYHYVRTKQKPILSVDHLAIRPQNNKLATDIYIIPKQWISFTGFNKGQINVVPLVSADNQVFPQAVTSNGALFLLAYVSQLPWVPSYWQIRYTAGFREGAIPRALNELIGIQAALDVLSDVGQSNRVQSYSLSQDNSSQSQTTPGPNVYVKRMEDLEKKKKTLLNRFKSIYGTKLAMGTI